MTLFFFPLLFLSSPFCPSHLFCCSSIFHFGVVLNSFPENIMFYCLSYWMFCQKTGGGKTKFHSGCWKGWTFCKSPKTYYNGCNNRKYCLESMFSHSIQISYSIEHWKRFPCDNEEISLACLAKQNFNKQTKFPQNDLNLNTYTVFETKRKKDEKISQKTIEMRCSSAIWI